MENDRLTATGQDTSFLDIFKNTTEDILDASVEALRARLRRDGPSQPSITLGGPVATSGGSDKTPEWLVPALGFAGVALLLASSRR